MRALIFNIFVFLGLLTQGIVAQTALHNSGNLRIHEGGQLGLHTDLINNSAFDQNAGLVGFYGGNRVVSGVLAPELFDMELAVDGRLFLDVGLGVTNNLNFISGTINTPRNIPSTTLNFIGNAFYVGEGNDTHVDGYTSITRQQDFVFPVGDGFLLRPLTLNSSGENPFAAFAYFNEDPNVPSTFDNGFDTNTRVRNLAAVSTQEFWAVQGSVSSTVTIGWNGRSQIANLTENDLEALTIVGWNIAARQWVILGNTAVTGDFNEGLITSDQFIPDDYSVITFGSLLTSPQDLLLLDNFYLTPNGDGINDVLVIEELEESPNNSIQIFDRFGLKVFEQQNYTNEFDGNSNISNLVIQRSNGLPVGVYFYIVNLEDQGLTFQGFLYLNR